MRLWLWDTIQHCGVTDNETRARQRAEECVADESTARVELALLSASFDTLTNHHIRTGIGWTVTRTAETVTWQPLAASEGTPARAS